ncbi:MAG TPA: TlpA disulfide reductase family protein [Candidatus Thermoplasmatota archaeon]|nr:TlpA disulfide reductase family protein [Candidatus Thermoplasmatota archaeon]
MNGNLLIVGVVAAFVVGAAALVAVSPPPASETGEEPLSTAALGEETSTAARPLDPANDLLFKAKFAAPPTALAGTTKFTDSFTVDRDYNFLEIGTGDEGVWAPAVNVYKIRVYDPEGTLVADTDWSGGLFPWVSLPNDRTWPSASVVAPAHGTYAIEVELSAGLTAIVSASGIAGPGADFSTEDILGKGTFTLSEHRGKVVLIDLMATWCGPCKRAMATLAEVYESYDRSQFEIVSVDVDTDETEEDLRNFMQTYGGVWYAGFDDGPRFGGTVSKGYGTGAIPTIAIIDPAGNWIFRHVGSDITADELRAIIDGALASA